MRHNDIVEDAFSAIMFQCRKTFFFYNILYFREDFRRSPPAPVLSALRYFVFRYQIMAIWSRLIDCDVTAGLVACFVTSQSKLSIFGLGSNSIQRSAQNKQTKPTYVSDRYSARFSCAGESIMQISCAFRSWNCDIFQLEQIPYVFVHCYVIDTVVMSDIPLVSPSSQISLERLWNYGWFKTQYFHLVLDHSFKLRSLVCNVTRIMFKF